jgi:hypothetical protein
MVAAMRTSIMRGLAISSVSLLVLPGCTSKRQQLRIKTLETDMETLQQEFDTTVEEKEKELSEKEEAYRKLENEKAEEIHQLTTEREKIAAEFAEFKKKAARTEADLLARVPKDASTPGHADFDPARETQFTHAMATITGDASTTCGFVVAADGKRYVYTTAGTLSGNSRLAITTANGDKLTKFGNLEVAEGCPFVRLELLEADDLPALQPAAASAQAESGTKLTCLGLSASSGSVTGEQTNAFGQSNDGIDTDPNALVGKVGGPVLETTTGKLLGIVVPTTAERTELWEDSTTPSGEPPQLRVSRVNRSLSWQPVPITTFLAEGKRIADFDRLTKIAQALAVVTIAPPANVLLDATVSGSHTAKSVLTEAKDFPPAVDAITLQTQLANKKLRLSGADLKKRVTSLFASTSGHMKRNATGFDPAKFSPYHRKMAENSLRWRKDAEDRLVTATEAVTNVDLSPPQANPDDDDRNQGRRR